MLAGRPPFGFLRWFQLFCFFHLVSAVCLPDQGSHFSFACLIRAAVFRLLAWLGQPFFVCHHRLWFGLSFFALGICGLFFLSLPQAFVYILFLSRPFLPQAFVLDFSSLRLFEGISVPLNCWHHALRLPLVRRVGGPRGQPASMLCSMDWRLTNGWSWFWLCLAWLRETCLVCDFVGVFLVFFFSFFFFSLFVSVFLLFSFLSFFFCLMSSDAKEHNY